jgi:hypothetical protein
MNMISAAQMYATKKGMKDERFEGVSMLLIVSQLEESVSDSKASWIGRLARGRSKNETNMTEGCDCPA